MLKEKMTLDEFKNIMKKQGEAIGEARGEAIGEARGVVKGKIETAKGMLEDNLPLAMIAKYTGLSEKDIEKLK